MLNIYFGTKHVFKENVIRNVSDYFDAEYDKTWLESDKASYIMCTIDGAKYLGDECVQLKDGTLISPRDLSTGCKALLLLLNVPRIIVSGDRMGDNCLRQALFLAHEMDITITLCHWVDFRKLTPFQIYDMNSGTILRTPELAMEAFIKGTYLRDDSTGSLLNIASHI